MRPRTSSPPSTSSSRHNVRVARGLVLLLLGACTQVYDLDTTDLAGADSDGDGVADDVDTCVDVPNPGAAQLDSDDDGRGDACDTCPLLVSPNQHDEDRDGIGDDCDACPALPDFGDDIDADGIGDLCDADNRASMRRLFDPFTSIEPRYTIAGTAWVASGDAAAPAAPLTMTDTGLEARGVTVAGDEWWVALGLHSESAWQDDRIEIVMRDAGGARKWSCGITCSAGMCTINVGGGLLVTYPVSSVVPDVVLRFYVRLAPTGGSAGVSCVIDPGNFQFTTFESAGLAGELWPSFVTQPSTQLRFVEVLE